MSTAPTIISSTTGINEVASLPISLAISRQTVVGQVTQTANTTNKCRPGAHRAPINNLGIDYHQYFSSSYLDLINKAVPPIARGNGNQARA